MSNPEKLQQINTNSPRETAVFSLGNTVMKRPIRLKSASQQTVWLNKQKQAQNIQAFLRAKNNPTYFVPQIINISCANLSVEEERVFGQPLTAAFVETLSDADQHIIYRGLANFINDMATYKPVLTQSEFFDISTDVKSDVKNTFAYAINHMKKYLNKQDIEDLKKAKAFFDKESLNDANVVFSHADMNEHNVFYDSNTKTLSVIDITDAKYENAHDMLYGNYANLNWLNIDRLISELNKIPAKHPIKTETNRSLVDLRNALYSVKCSAMEILKRPNDAGHKIRVKLLQGTVNLTNQMYEAAKKAMTNNCAKSFVFTPVSTQGVSR